MNQQAIAQARAAFDIEAACIAKNKETLDWQSFGRVLEVLAAAPRIAASGCGHSGIACRHFAHLLCCIGRPARFLSPSEALHGGMGFLTRGDVLVLASRGGRTDELLPMLAIAKAKGATVIGITENSDSPLAIDSDHLLNMVVERECDKFNSQGTSSFAALCAIFDALQVALIERTGYDNGQFARDHPGGAVGKRLNDR